MWQDRRNHHHPFLYGRARRAADQHKTITTQVTSHAKKPSRPHGLGWLREEKKTFLVASMTSTNKTLVEEKKIYTCFLMASIKCINKIDVAKKKIYKKEEKESCGETELEIFLYKNG